MSKRIKCKFCDAYFLKPEEYVSHLESTHSDMIPEDMDAWQFAYFLRTGKTEGSCITCKGPTTWNPKTHKYNRYCDNPKCKEAYREVFKKRMIGKYGKITLLNDPEQQKIMLSRRKISGEYNWSDGSGVSVFTGTYEKAFLEFLDTCLNFSASDIIAPSPHTYYYIYENAKHFYIPDFYIPSLNLEVEIKEGTNTHPKIQAVDKVKEKLKDDVMKSNSKTINYVKIVEKDHTRFLQFLDLAKTKYMETGELRGIILC